MDPIQSQPSMQPPTQTPPNFPQEPPKSHWPLIAAIVIIILAIAGGAYWYLNYYQKSTTSVGSNNSTTVPPVVEKDNTTPPSSIDLGSKEKAWTAMQAVMAATKNNDNLAFNQLLTVPKPDCNSSTADCPYMEPIKQILSGIQKEDIQEIWEDDKQLIAHATKQTTSGSNITFEINNVIFTKKSDGSLDFLGIRPYSAIGTSLQTLQDKLKDSDQDGFIDGQELCTGDFAYSGCVKTDPFKKDTDMNGYWDSSDGLYNEQMNIIKETENPKVNTAVPAPKPPTSTSNVEADLIVTGIIVYPSHPIVNSKDVKITYTIKNIGTKATSKAFTLVSRLIGFTSETPVQGGNLKPLQPGETWSYDFTPYSSNDFFKVSDTPGNKTVEIVVNPKKDVVESNYDNDVFTQDVQMYAN